MAFNELYVSLLHPANLLSFTNIVHHGMPIHDHHGMVDRWRPKTHSFHLPYGEMMVTLEDVAMILGLSIRGRPVTGYVDSVSWLERVAAFVSREPPVKVAGVKGREAEVRMTWLREEFRECPLDVDEAIVTLYARAWVWHMFAIVLFPDSTGDVVSWVYIPTLAD
jgi:hypothetical protein